MPTGDEYRIKAADIAAQAKQEISPLMRAQFENLALAYLRLADLADQNATADIVYETPREQPSVGGPRMSEPNTD